MSINPYFMEKLIEAREAEFRSRRFHFSSGPILRRRGDTKIKEALREVAEGREAVVFRRGVAVARLVPICSC